VKKRAEFLNFILSGFYFEIDQGFLCSFGGDTLL